MFPDGAGNLNKSLVPDTSLAPLRRDNLTDIERRSLKEMRKQGVVREEEIGLATSFLFRVSDADQIYLELAEKGITYYDIKP